MIGEQLNAEQITLIHKRLGILEQDTRELTDIANALLERLLTCERKTQSLSDRPDFVNCRSCGAQLRGGYSNPNCHLCGGMR